LHRRRWSPLPVSFLFLGARIERNARLAQVLVTRRGTPHRRGHTLPEGDR
jgi:hypothetical protein